TKGRTNFWFYLFKTSMFGEFDFEKPILRKSASFLSGIFLLLVLLIIVGVYSAKKDFFSYIPFLISLFLFAISMIAFRIDYPYSSSNDFRYIYPVIIPAVSIMGAGMMTIQNLRRFFVLLFAFIVNSVFFQISMLLAELGL